MSGLRMCVYVCHLCARCPADVEEGVSSPEVEFRVVVSQHVVLVTKHQFSAGKSKCFSSPKLIL